VRTIRLAWLGIRSNHYEATVELLRDVLGLEVAFEEEQTVELALPAGERVQVFGPGHRYHEHFAGSGPVPLFEVDDLAAADARLRDNGLEVIRRDSDSHWDWLEFRGPDGSLYSLGARRG
jgi:catechol 2,3-dioxygenase-like lactoylglutathione lyase family enzyme